MKYIILIFCLYSSTIFAQDSIYSIAFGSCSDQNKPLPIFNVIEQHNPDLFIYLGDNIYADTKNMCKLRRKYCKLKRNKDFKHFRKNIPIIATWDDHDYGTNDVGRHYVKKEKSKKIFLHFFKEPKKSERRNHTGIYTSYYYYFNGKTLQIILLDNRTFRDDLFPFNGKTPMDTVNGNIVEYNYNLEYSQYLYQDSTILGTEQWNWLENELKKPADIRIIGSSTQFGTQYNGYESWANFPLEQKRMLNLIATTGATGIFFISGDLHYSELSKLENEYTYPIYDLTSSGLTEEWKFAAPNKYRIGDPIMENNFGMIHINWSKLMPEIKMEIWDANNTLRLEYLLKIEDLKW